MKANLPIFALRRSWRNLSNWPRQVPALAAGLLIAGSSRAAYPPQWYEAMEAPAALGNASLRGIAFGGGFFSVVPAWDATAGKWTSATSPGGSFWTKGTAFPVQRQLYAIASSGSLFVGVGESGLVMTSSDGASWTEATSGVTADLNDVVWGDGVFVAVGGSGKVIHSTNGSTWMTASSGTSTSLTAVGFGNGKFIIPSSSSSILTSSNGSTWVSASTGASNRFGKPVYGNGLWVAGGGGSLFTTTNPNGGTGWSSRGMGATIGRVAFANGVFVAHATSGGTATVFSSVASSTEPGAEWTSVMSPLDAFTPITSIATDGSRFVAVGSSGRVIYSDPVAPPGPGTATVAVEVSPVQAGTSSGGGAFTVGTQVQISATPASGDFWRFKEWKEDGSTQNPRTITVPANDITYTAVFQSFGGIALDTNTAFVVPAGTQVPPLGSFSLEPPPQNGRWLDGTVVTVSISPAPNMAFVGWGDGSVLDNPLIIEIYGGRIRSGTAYFAFSSFHDEALFYNLAPDFAALSPAHDAIPNGVKYASNISPTEMARELVPGGTKGLPRVERITLPVAAEVAGDAATAAGLLQVEYLKRKDPALHYVVEFSSNLLDWLPATQPPAVTPLNNLWDRVLQKDDPGMSTVPSRYARVRFARD